MASNIKITAQPAPDPEVCRFLVDQPLLPGAERNFKSAQEAANSPLASLLFDLEGVAMVGLKEDTVTITKADDQPWPELAKLIGGAIRAHVLSGQPAVELAAVDDELSSKVDLILKERINPGLASHGGYAELARVEENVAYVSLGGGCQGCAMSQMTLKQGIERQLMELVPELVSVVDVTDHNSGQNAYFKWYCESDGMTGSRTQGAL